MRIPRFYEPTQLAEGQLHSLSDTVVQHVCKVLRMKTGDHIHLFDGNGNEYSCIIEQADKRSASVKVQATRAINRQSPLNIHIGQSISRGERMDYAVQKATEMGMYAMTPLFTERCEVRLNSERQDKRIRHWQQVAISACEQSLRNTLPVINPADKLQDWLGSVEADLKLVLHHHTQTPLNQMATPTSIALLVGPEGGLTDEEISMAVDAGFQPVTLGPRVMRTETAPVAALSILQYLWGDLG